MELSYVPNFMDSLMIYLKWKKRESHTVVRPTFWGPGIAHLSWTDNAEPHADMNVIQPETLTRRLDFIYIST